MSESVWNRFGLKGNPYDTSPLEEGADLDLEQVFVGREKETELINRVLASSNGGRVAICGKPGVGKTTLANFVKYGWKYKRTDKVLFSSRTELEAGLSTLNKRSFLLEVLGSVYREIKLRDPKLAEQGSMLEIRSLIDLGRMKEMSGGFTTGIPIAQFSMSKTFGGGFALPAEITDSTLVSYFEMLISFIKENEIAGIKYAGIIVHMNNFDIVMNSPDSYEKVVGFFNEIRDILQTKDSYFVFLGPQDFYNAVIDKSDRVKAIFSTPIMLSPLSKTDLVKALNQRLEALQSSGVVRINPFQDDVIYRFYDLYNGDIRNILNALSAIVVEAGESAVEALSYKEALYYFSREKMGQLKSQLTEEQFKFLERVLSKSGSITQKDMAQEMDVAPNNVSSYYFKPLKDFGVIHEVGKDGKFKFWDLTEHYVPLREYYKDAKRDEEDIVKKIKESTRAIQQRLF